jgi:hypothetical protein
MKRFATNILLATIIGVISLTSAPVLAKDWIEKVSVGIDGIDVKSIEVRANSQGYTSIKTNSHRFLFGLYARATNGERIVGAILSSLNGAEFFEGKSPSEWRRKFTGRDVGAGSLRTWSFSYKPDVPVSKIKWQGKTPVQICKAILASKMQHGQSKASVLSKTWNSTAKAHFQLQAVAAHKNKAKNNSWKMQHTDSERKSMTYPVYVRCLSKS